MDTLRQLGPRGLARAANLYIRRRSKQFVVHPFLAPIAIPKIRQYEPTSLEDLFNWASTAYMGLVKPGQQPGEFIDLLRILQERRPKTIPSWSTRVRRPTWSSST